MSVNIPVKPHNKLLSYATQQSVYDKNNERLLLADYSGANGLTIPASATTTILDLKNVSKFKYIHFKLYTQFANTDLIFRVVNYVEEGNNAPSDTTNKFRIGNDDNHFLTFPLVGNLIKITVQNQSATQYKLYGEIEVSRWYSQLVNQPIQESVLRYDVANKTLPTCDAIDNIVCEKNGAWEYYSAMGFISSFASSTGEMMVGGYGNLIADSGEILFNTNKDKVKLTSTNALDNGKAWSISGIDINGKRQNEIIYVAGVASVNKYTIVDRFYSHLNQLNVGVLKLVDNLNNAIVKNLVEVGMNQTNFLFIGKESNEFLAIKSISMIFNTAVPKAVFRLMTYPNRNVVFETDIAETTGNFQVDTNIRIMDSSTTGLYGRIINVDTSNAALLQATNSISVLLNCISSKKYTNF